jgi:beta-lactamase class A
LTDLRQLAIGETLGPASRARLVSWLVANQTGDRRLRAGFPRSWKIGDKTGSGDHGTTNDLAIAWPEGRAPVLVSVYLTGANENSDARDETIASVGKQISAIAG